MGKNIKSYLEDPELYEIYETFIKKGFDVNPDLFFKNLKKAKFFYELNEKDPLTTYNDLIKYVEGLYKTDNTRIFFINCLYGLYKTESQSNWKIKKYIEYLKNYETEYIQKRNSNNMKKIIYTGLKNIIDSHEKQKEVHKKQEKDFEKLVKKYPPKKDISLSGNNSDSSNQIKKRKKTKVIIKRKKGNYENDLKPYKLTQMQLALFIHYLEESHYQKRLYSIAAIEQKTKVNAAKLILKKFNIGNSPNHFIQKYNLINQRPMNRINVSQVSNLKKVISILDQYPDAKKIAEEELKKAEISDI